MIAKVAAAMRFNSPALGRLIRRPYATASATSLRMEFPALGDTDRSSGDATDTSRHLCIGHARVSPDLYVSRLDTPRIDRRRRQVR